MKEKRTDFGIETKKTKKENADIAKISLASEKVLKLYQKLGFEFAGIISFNMGESTYLKLIASGQVEKFLPGIMDRAQQVFQQRLQMQISDYIDDRLNHLKALEVETKRLKEGYMQTITWGIPPERALGSKVKKMENGSRRKAYFRRIASELIEKAKK